MEFRATYLNHLPDTVLLTTVNLMLPCVWQGVNDTQSRIAVNPLTCRFSSGEVPLLLSDVAHIPSVSYHVFFRVSQPTKWHIYTGNKDDVRVKFKASDTLFSLSVRREAGPSVCVSPRCTR